MIAPLREFQDCILSHGDSVSATASDDALLFRLHDAIRSPSGYSDLAVLVRQALVRAELLSKESEQLRIPREAPWPSVDVWTKFGCKTEIAGPKHFFLRAERWVPSWLDEKAPEVVEASIAQELRRRPRKVASDPLVSEFAGLENYISPGQRIAVQSVFLTPSHSTVIVDLPTGSGKTLAFHLPALASTNDGGLTVVVVPTVALARDQEQRFRGLQARKAGHGAEETFLLAYHSGLRDDQKQAIQTRIREGAQSIVFTSPEALGGGLRGPLFEAAQRGRLRYFVIDEAHVVTQWGQQFRPEFQSISGLRDALLAACPTHTRFRTLLLTGTLTQECYDALRLLFGENGCYLVGEPALRPEPGFLLYSAAGEAERHNRIIEALRFLPRPLILYTTLREDAEKWLQSLHIHGFQRVRMVRGGDLATDDGDLLLKEWQERKFDVVIATSAFGLGVDHSEVRSIVHACLPETIDRYYQEVGRAGRDGCASVALLVSTPDDAATAEGLAIERLISVDRGYDRWDAMWVRRRVSGGKYVVSLDDRPADIAESGVRNVSWNLRTLVLMAQARLVQFASHEPPKIEPNAGEDPLKFELRRRAIFERFAHEIAVRILDDRHWDKKHWEAVVEHTRAGLRARDRESLDSILELRQLRRPLNEIFRSTYTLEDPFVTLPLIHGSCPVTRRLGIAGFNSPEPEVILPGEVFDSLAPDFKNAMNVCSDEHRRIWLLCPRVGNDAKERRKWREALMSFLKYAAAAGILEFCLPEALLSQNDWTQLIRQSGPRFLLRTSHSNPETAALAVPRLTLVGDSGPMELEIESAMKMSRPWHIILFRDNTPDPRAKHRNLIDVVRYLSVDNALARLRL